MNWCIELYFPVPIQQREYLKHTSDIFLSSCSAEQLQPRQKKIAYEVFRSKSDESEQALFTNMFVYVFDSVCHSNWLCKPQQHAYPISNLQVNTMLSLQTECITKQEGTHTKKYLQIKKTETNFSSNLADGVHFICFLPSSL